MNEPNRLRNADGPAAVLLRGSGLEVPGAARRRALTFASTLATGFAATSTAGAAGATSLAKSFAIYLAFGAMGGGALSLAASSVVSLLEPPSAPVAPVKATPAPVQPNAPEPPAAIPMAPTDPVSPVPAPLDKPRSSTSDARPSTPATSLFEEQRAVEKARAAISRGDAGSGLALLDDYERSYARRQFGPEALALRVEALRLKGQVAATRSRAIEFERRYPRHPLLARVRELAK